MGMNNLLTDFLFTQGETRMRNILLDEMIITCEACGNVKRFRVKSQKDCDKILKEFTCENNCGRNLLSYITVGSLQRDYIQNQQISFAIAK